MVGSKGIESKIKQSLVLVHRCLDPVAHTLNPGPHARGVPEQEFLGDIFYFGTNILLWAVKEKVLVRNERKREREQTH